MWMCSCIVVGEMGRTCAKELFCDIKGLKLLSSSGVQNGWGIHPEWTGKLIPSINIQLQMHSMVSSCSLIPWAQQKEILMEIHKGNSQECLGNGEVLSVEKEG